MIGHAVIVGGGVGGLLAAHALAARCQRVTVLERAHYPGKVLSPAPQARQGVPQSHCLHMLMAAGVAAFDDLIPGWRQTLVGKGAVPFDASADAAMRFPAGWLPKTRSGVLMYACSRSLLEEVLLGGFGADSTVRVRQGRQVLGLLVDKSGRKVTGVLTADSEGVGEKPLAADLVVDASGTASRLRRWLAGLYGSPSPEVAETVIESDWQYVSRWFRLKLTDAPDWQCLSIAPAKGTKSRAAMMLRAENDHWNVVLLARADDALPADGAAFQDFAAGLGEGKLCDALKSATPASPIHHYGRTANRMRHFDRLTSWPDGLVALGDSVCTLDPYFGLGMTAAARGAVLLGTYLERHRGVSVDGLGFQKELAQLNARPWQLATGYDRDGRPLKSDHEYISRLYDAAPSCPEIAHAVIAVQHLLRPAEKLREVITL